MTISHHVSDWGDDRIQELSDFQPRQRARQGVALVERYVDSSGKSRIKGNKNLKLSQSYPIGLLGCFWVLQDQTKSESNLIGLENHICASVSNGIETFSGP